MKYTLYLLITKGLIEALIKYASLQFYMLVREEFNVPVQNSKRRWNLVILTSRCALQGPF